MKYTEIIEKMTLEEKASLTSGKDFWQTEAVKRLNIPSIFLSDGPHGIRKQAAAADHLGLNASIPATCFPTAVTMANSWNLALGEEMGKALGEEARTQKVNILLGPGMNIKRDPRCGRNFEYFSEDPYLAGKMAAAYVRGIQSEGVSACIKHFACNNQETRRMVYDSIVDERALREIYLTGFEIAVKEGKPMSIMTSYNRLNGDYTNENYHLLTEILREEWGYDGFIVTDWGGNNNRVKALIAGNALEMPTTQGETNEEIIKAIKDGELDEKVLDARIDEYLHVALETSKALVEERPADMDAHHVLAKKCAEEAIVLLKNEGNVLPLRKENKVVLVGDFFKTPRYQGAGSSVVNPTKMSSLLDLTEEFEFDYVGYAQGYDRYGKKKKGLAKKAVELAKNADVILYAMGLDEVTEAEGLDRKDILLAENQLTLLKSLKELGKPVVVVLTCGAVVDLSWDNDADALLHAYLSGQAGAEAILSILNGKVNPSGKLSETFPVAYSDVPSSKEFPHLGMTAPYKESIYVGYRFFDKNNMNVKYPFGFGLSYTSFEYSNLKVTKDGVTFTIKNTGKVDGKEVAQLYVGLKDTKIFRADRELKGFTKVFIKAGESVDATIPFDDRTFRFFNVQTNTWEIEGGTYQIYVGPSSRELPLTGELKVKGIDASSIYNREDVEKYFKGDVLEVTDAEFEKVLGRKLPPSEIPFVKKNRIFVDYNSTVMDLRYARGWTGRLFAGAIRFAERLLRFFGNRTLANTLVMGVFHNPMRGLSRMSGGMISWEQLTGLMIMFNGHFFKGFKAFLRGGKIKKARAKAKKAKEAEEAKENKETK